ncbi:hypothetical protein L1887_05971 [Cichorium endivia]|nr:hypothetical protein L1887_05971 [Cichorium endivia]
MEDLFVYYINDYIYLTFKKIRENWTHKNWVHVLKFELTYILRSAFNSNSFAAPLLLACFIHGDGDLLLKLLSNSFFTHLKEATDRLTNHLFCLIRNLMILITSAFDSSVF